MWDKCLTYDGQDYICSWISSANLPYLQQLHPVPECEGWEVITPYELDVTKVEHDPSKGQHDGKYLFCRLSDTLGEAN